MSIRGCGISPVERVERLNIWWGKTNIGTAALGCSAGRSPAALLACIECKDRPTKTRASCARPDNRGRLSLRYDLAYFDLRLGPQLLCQPRPQLFVLALLQFRLQIAFYFFEALFLGCVVRIQSDDGVSRLNLNQSTDLPRLHGQKGFD